MSGTGKRTYIDNVVLPASLGPTAMKTGTATGFGRKDTKCSSIGTKKTTSIEMIIICGVAMASRPPYKPVMMISEKALNVTRRKTVSCSGLVAGVE